MSTFESKLAVNIRIDNEIERKSMLIGPINHLTLAFHFLTLIDLSI